MFQTQSLSHKAKKIGWIILTIAACLIWALIIVFIFGIIDGIIRIVTGSQIDMDTMGAISGVFAIIGFIAIIILSVTMWKRIKERCPACKKLGAMEYFKQELIGEKDINVPMTLSRKNRRGEVIDTYQQYVSGSRKTYRNTYKCKYCGHIETHTYNRDSANV